MLKKSALAIAISFASITVHAEAGKTPSLEEMWQLIQQQQAEIANLKSQLNKTETKLEETEVKVIATADAVEQGAVVGGKLAKVAEWAEKTTIGGYGEHHYNHKRDGDDQVDAHRFVAYIGHQFNDNVRFFSEIELEHGLSGDDKPGEVELEQAYIEWDYAQNHSVQFGQFLIPVGIMNEVHEPDTFYGTERNLVEKNIIPTTWWETGVMFKGEVAPGLAYNLGVHSGLEIEDQEDVRGGRQKSAKATAEDFAYTARLKYTGIAGLELAATVQYQTDVTQGFSDDTNDDGNDDFFADGSSALLTEAHVIYSVGDAQVRALWAQWDIEGDDFEANGYDKQEGWYIEPSYKLTEKLGVFTRYSEYNNQASLAGVEDKKVWDYGLNYWLTPTVVLKADYSNNVDVDGEDKDSLNLGVGWSF